MVSPLSKLRPSNIAATLFYFDKHDFPLTPQELFYWSSPKAFHKSQFSTYRGFYFLPGRQHIVATRNQRQKVSKEKWQVALQVGEQLKKFSTIQAVFVTGSLAMDNAKSEDDIDLMIVTKANTLWITRILVNLFLLGIRRRPGQIQVANTVCLNLWLDENHLAIVPHTLYMAHEILQAKVLWSKNNIASVFLQANKWVNGYLPNAYPPQPDGKYEVRRNLFFETLNYLFFLVQYLYMVPKMTSERVSPGFAFFHPTKN